jgi:hypothetical protein
MHPGSNSTGMRVKFVGRVGSRFLPILVRDNQIIVIACSMAGPTIYILPLLLTQSNFPTVQRQPGMHLTQLGKKKCPTLAQSTLVRRPARFGHINNPQKEELVERLCGVMDIAPHKRCHRTQFAKVVTPRTLKSNLEIDCQEYITVNLKLKTRWCGAKGEVN